jgi:hypothetical protein
LLYKHIDLAVVRLDGKISKVRGRRKPDDGSVVRGSFSVRVLVDLDVLAVLHST